MGCIDPTPNINDDDVSKAKGRALYEGIKPSDGQELIRPTATTNVTPAGTENFGDRTFEEVHNEFKNNADKWVVQAAVDEAWREIGHSLREGATNFRTAIDGLINNTDVWAGETIRAAADNAKQSVTDPMFTGSAALRGAELARKFRDTMEYVHTNLVGDGSVWVQYQRDLNNAGWNFSNQQTVKDQYNSYMRTIMADTYVPGIKAITGGYPQFAQGDARPPGNAPQIPGVGLGTPGGRSPAGGPGGSGGGSPSTPTPPKPTSAQEWASALPQPQGQDAAQNGLGDAASGAGDALGQATGAAGDALGQATDAAGQAANTAGQAASSLAGLGGMGKPALPEGMLNLGNKADLARGLSEAGRAGRGGGGAGGGGAGGIARELASRAPTTPASSTSGTNATQSGASRAGIASGSPGAGAPAAGARGAGGDGKEHKANKALRSRRNGSEVVGDADAVLPVIGEDGATPESTSSRK